MLVIKRGNKNESITKLDTVLPPCTVKFRRDIMGNFRMIKEGR